MLAPPPRHSGALVGAPRSSGAKLRFAKPRLRPPLRWGGRELSTVSSDDEAIADTTHGDDVEAGDVELTQPPTQARDEHIDRARMVVVDRNVLAVDLHRRERRAAKRARRRGGQR